MKPLSKVSVTLVEVSDDSAGQRLDNFLLRQCKGVPKSHIYRIIRDGQVRVNSKRVDPKQHLELGDKVRIPPLRMSQKNNTPLPPGEVKLRTPLPRGEGLGVRENRVTLTNQKSFETVFEDNYLLAINKPAGVAVHGGSGISFGVIEQLRQQRPEAKFLELVHRLDRETSGVLLLAKKRSALVGLHEMIREGQLEKHYLTLVKGEWKNAKQHVKLALHKYVTQSGERRVSVEAAGRPSHTLFTLRESYKNFSLLEAELKTGRTHQIRVHLAHLDFPICGDDKYGIFTLNKQLIKQGLKRMFLHAWKIAFQHPQTGEKIELVAPLPVELDGFLKKLKKKGM